MQVDDLYVMEVALSEVGADQLDDRAGALAGHEPEVHLNKGLRWNDGL
jgi:hypothetical protein